MVHFKVFLLVASAAILCWFIGQLFSIITAFALSSVLGYGLGKCINYLYKNHFDKIYGLKD